MSDEFNYEEIYNRLRDLPIEKLKACKEEEIRAYALVAIDNRAPKDLERAFQAGLDPSLIYCKEPLVFFAASRGKAALMTLFIQAGYDVSAARGNYKKTLLHVTSGASLSILIEAGVPLDAQDKGGNTAALVATVHFDMDSLERLVRAGARLDIPNNNGKTVQSVAEAMPNGERKRHLERLIRLAKELHSAPGHPSEKPKSTQPREAARNDGVA